MYTEQVLEYKSHRREGARFIIGPGHGHKLDTGPSARKKLTRNLPAGPRSRNISLERRMNCARVILKQWNGRTPQMGFMIHINAVSYFVVLSN